MFGWFSEATARASAVEQFDCRPAASAAGKHLESDPVPHDGVFRQVDVAHAAGPKLIQKSVAATDNGAVRGISAWPEVGISS